MTPIAFVLGNGTSRKPINPEHLKAHGTVYGCNALYRSFSPDYLVAVDTKMIVEITDAGYHLNNQVWTNPNKLSKRIEKLNLFNPNKGWSSGPTALHLASTNMHKTIYILGFDYIGLGEQNEKVNNIYAGTDNYKREQDRATYYGNWTRQTSLCIQTHPKTKYIRIIKDNNSFIPEQLQNLTNLSHITLEDFTKNLKIKHHV
jgi:hypothetical protein